MAFEFPLKEYIFWTGSTRAFQQYTPLADSNPPIESKVVLRMNDFISDLTQVSNSARQDLSFDTLHDYVITNNEWDNRIVMQERYQCFNRNI